MIPVSTTSAFPHGRQAASGLQFDEPSIFECGAEGRFGASIADLDVPERTAEGIFGPLARKTPAGLPQVSEPEAVRHFVRLSQWNFAIDTQFYPLGSCTMKYNPKVNEWAARLHGFTGLHPYMPDAQVQGALSLMFELERALAEIAGMDHVSLQPAAGAQGELTGLMMIRAYHASRGRAPKKVFVPDSAHGTNPASCSLNGLETISVPSRDGLIGFEEVARALDTAGDDVAAFMVTNPNTVGLYEQALPEVCRLVHERGGLVYGDGANMNAVLGRARPGDIGVDIMQYNLHKTFTTPHGGGGPGCGPVAYKALLADYAPAPSLEKHADGSFYFEYQRPKSVGRVRAFYGNFGMMVRAYTYLREMGAEGLKSATDMAVLNANYLRARLGEEWHVAYDRTCMHEVVISDRQLKQTGVTTLDVAKRLLDYGFHPPTVYFPLVVKGAMLIEPTETETKQTLDEFVDVLSKIKDEAERDPELLKGAPHLTRLRRLDETRAARKPVLRWRPEAR
jgi:glycine dehydrogenase subunit 2